MCPGFRAQGVICLTRLCANLPVHTANLCELIRDRIRQRLNTRVSNLEVEEEAGAIVLTGRCATFHTKQLAQHAALGVLNDEPLENRIEVLIP